MEDLTEVAGWSPKVVQNGNPFSLAINQHIFPRNLIANFAGKDGNVWANFTDGSRAIRRGAGDKSFCLNRVWDQRTENYSTKEYELPFQRIATRLVRGRSELSTTDDMVKCTKMYALWQFRSWIAENPPPEMVLHSIKVPPGHYGYNQSEGEELEKSHLVPFYYTETPDSEGWVSPVSPGRMNVWHHMRRHILSSAAVYENRRWGVLLDPFENVVIPDRCPQKPLLPLCPKLCLIGDVESMTQTETQSNLIKSFLLKDCQEFWISKG